MKPQNWIISDHKVLSPAQVPKQKARVLSDPGWFDLNLCTGSSTSPVDRPHWHEPEVCIFYRLDGNWSELISQNKLVVYECNLYETGLDES